MMLSAQIGNIESGARSQESVRSSPRVGARDDSRKQLALAIAESEAGVRSQFGGQRRIILSFRAKRAGWASPTPIRTLADTPTRSATAHTFLPYPPAKNCFSRSLFGRSKTSAGVPSSSIRP